MYDPDQDRDFAEEAYNRQLLEDQRIEAEADHQEWLDAKAAAEQDKFERDEHDMMIEEGIL